jgi:agmatinase
MNEIAIQGILFDEKSSYLKGASEAPPAIRECFHSGSSNYFSELGVNTWDLPEIQDFGDFDIEYYFQIEAITLQLLKSHAKILSLGGDHSISFPILKAFNTKYNKIHVLQFDAHSDLYAEYEGDPFSHACPFARIMENNYAHKLTQIGVRTLNPHQKAQAKKFDVQIFEARDLDSISELYYSNPVYISLDMDVFDPAYAPGVSHHEPGGLTSRQVIDIIQTINAPIIGADIVEYNPSRDIHGITASLAVKCLKEILGKMLHV